MPSPFAVQLVSHFLTSSACDVTGLRSSSSLLKLCTSPPTVLGWDILIKCPNQRLPQLDLSVYGHVLTVNILYSQCYESGPFYVECTCSSHVFECECDCLFVPICQPCI